MTEDAKPKTTLQKAEERLSSLASTLSSAASSATTSLTSSATSTASSLTSSAAKTASSIAGTSGSTHIFPAFDDLPKIPGQPQGCMWGYWDNGPIKDEIGTLNLLTPMVVRQASAEIRTGEHVQLDWGLENVEFPSFGRRKMENKVMGKLQTETVDGEVRVTGGACVLDNEVHMNTQSGSQWDSHKHFAHQASGMFYNGLSYADALASPRNGIHNWCARGGIVARGILVDWLRWHEVTRPEQAPPSPIAAHAIPITDIIATLAFQGTVPRPGDILLIRSGFVRWHNFATSETRKAWSEKSQTPEMLGLEGSEETIRWLYEQHFAAVGGDAMAFESWPPKTSQRGEEGETWCLHEW
jgi:hypothetical protein